MCFVFVVAVLSCLQPDAYAALSASATIGSMSA